MTSASAGPIDYQAEDGIATITIDRPLVGNALDRDALHALMIAAIRADEDRATRCVILTGRGRFFCAGGDVTSFSKAGDDLPSLMKEITVYLNAAVSRLARMEKPLIVAVNGAAAGAGLGLAMMGDIVVAADTAIFTTAYSKVGLSPDAGVSYWLPRLVGLRAAQELIWTSRKVDAREALALGLVTRVVPPEILTAEVMATARAVAEAGTPAAGATRALLMSSHVSGLEEQLELEARAISRLSADARPIATERRGDAT